jgi:hypothetical protein
MKINVDDKVKIVKAEGVLVRYEDKIGKVDRIYYETTPPIAIVKFEGEECIFTKVPLENLVKVEIEAQVETAEIREGAKKISRDEFRAAIESVIRPENILTENSDGMSAFVRGVTTMIVGDAVETAIFKDADGVVMTEDEFISELWSACNPVALSESVKKGVSASKCITVAITALIGLDEVVGILFGGSDD